MPIAHCHLREDVAVPDAADELVERWAAAAGVPPVHMTVNLVPGVLQAGAGQPAMATLYLPSLWNAEQAERLAVGLAEALMSCFALGAEDVHVIVQRVASGAVVAGGEPQRW